MSRLFNDLILNRKIPSAEKALIACNTQASEDGERIARAFTRIDSARLRRAIVRLAELLGPLP